MEEFLRVFDEWICAFWNMFYDLLCDVTGAEVDEQWYIDTIFRS